jgi:hypothetical protein
MEKRIIEGYYLYGLITLADVLGVLTLNKGNNWGLLSEGVIVLADLYWR